MSTPCFDDALNHTNAIWDDGEWVSWAEINRFIEGKSEADEEDLDIWDDEDDDGQEPNGVPEEETSMAKLRRLEKQIARAREALQCGEDIGARIGEMGELYAEAQFRFQRHRKYAQGSDGRMGHQFVEVKTISPWKQTPQVRVKRAGHWSKLIVVKINEQWIFEAKVFNRADLGRGKGGRHIRVKWE